MGEEVCRSHELISASPVIARKLGSTAGFVEKSSVVLSIVGLSPPSAEAQTSPQPLTRKPPLPTRISSRLPRRAHIHSRITTPIITRTGPTAIHGAGAGVIRGGWEWPIGVSVGFGGCFNYGFRGAFFHPGFGRFGFGHTGFFHPGFGHFGFADASFGGGFRGGGRR